MYAEERQQAIADLVAQRGRLSVNALAAEYAVTTETVRRDLSVARARRAGPRRVHGGAVPAARADRARGRRRRARPRARRREGPDRPGGARPAARRPAAAMLLDAGTTTARLALTAPPRPAADRGHPRRPDRRPAGRLAQHRPAPAARPGPLAPPRPRSAPTPSRRSSELRADVAFVGTNGRHRRPRPDHPRPRRGRRQARDGRRRPPGRRARRLLQDRPASTPSGSPSLGEIDVRRHRRRRSTRRRPAGARADAGASRCVVA